MRLEILEGTDIHAMMSSEGEKIVLNKHIKVRNNVESWLMLVQMGMVETI